MHTNLIQALEKQIRYCEQYERCRFGIFVRTQIQREIVTKCISNLLPDSIQVRCRNNNYESGFCWNNGSYIKILSANDSIRGNRFNGVIIVNEIDRDIVNSLIMSCLRERIDSTGRRIEEFSSIKDRIFTVAINKSDVIESQNHSIYISTAWQRNNMPISRGLRNSNIFVDDLCEDDFIKEYVSMFDNHTVAYKVAQVGTDKIYIYNAVGIPKENIKYETEFVNRNKETYLNIKGEYKINTIDFGNEINVHLLVDTDIYDKYEVDIRDGFVFVTLHEIINEKPVLEDITIKD